MVWSTGRARSRPTEQHFLVRLLDRWLFNNQLEQELGKQRVRRGLVFISVMCPISNGYLMGYAAWAIMAPNPETELVQHLLALAFVVTILISSVLPFMLVRSIQSVISFGGAALDERQQQLNTQAEADARRYIMRCMLVLIATGLAILIAVQAGALPFSNPLYGGIPIYLGVGWFLYVLSTLIPGLLTAWRLPDELAEDVE